jgi:general secretion pathway protein D
VWQRVLDWVQAVGRDFERAEAGTLRRREAALESARKLMLQGDRLMADKDYAGALDAYRTSFHQMPDSTGTRQLRAEALTRYEAALQPQARATAEQGRLDDARALVKQFYQEVREAGFPPTAIGPATKQLAADLEDGETFEVANTPEMVKRRQEVQRLFGEAGGAVQTGQFDKATLLYGQILNLDPTNSAARRGMEQVDKMVSEYNKAAQDHTRAKALAQVTAGWENPVPKFALPDLEKQPAATPATMGSIREKLRSIVFTDVQFAETPLKEVISYLAARSQELDPVSGSGQRGVNIILSSNDPALALTPVSIQMRNAPLDTVLDYVAQIARMKVRIEDVAVALVPLSAPDQLTIITKSYRVPPNFISSGATGAGGGDDPFGAAATTPAATTTLQKKLTAVEFLKMNGVSFPEGASAEYINATSTLLVRNTQDQLELIEAMIESSFGSVAKLLRIDVKTMEIAEEKLHELGFDWLLDQFNLPGSERVFGSGGTVGTATAGTASEEFPFVPPGSTTPLGRFPLTAGNRSGESAQSPNAIETAINRDVSFGAQGAGRVKAPGIFSLGGIFTDPQFQVVVRGIQQSAARDLVASNTVVARAGQQAVLKSVREFIYPTEYDPPQVPDTVGLIPLGNNTVLVTDSTFAPITPAHPTAFETRELGSLVQVEGSIGADNYTIDLTMTPEVSRFEGFINYGSPIRQYENDALGRPYVAQEVQNKILMPVFKVLRNSVNVSVYSGQTAVVGGLLESRIQEVNDKTPILGDVPLVGQFFRSKSDQRQRRAVIFFVTVNIIDPSGGVVHTPTATTASL